MAVVERADDGVRNRCGIPFAIRHSPFHIRQVVAVHEVPVWEEFDLEADGESGIAVQEDVPPGDDDGVGRRDEPPRLARTGGFGQEAPVRLRDDAE